MLWKNIESAIRVLLCDFLRPALRCHADHHQGPFCQPVRLPSLAQEKEEKGESSQVANEEPPPYTPILGPVPSHTPPPAPRPHHATLDHLNSSISPQEPPSYDAAITQSAHPRHVNGEKSFSSSSSEDVIHYLSPEDNIQTLSIAYGVPATVLKSHNALHSDHLLSARRTIKIPGSHYQGPSLSPNPLESQEEVERKSKIRKLMVQCKVSEYKVALMYLEEAKWDLEKAIAKVEEDDRWEKEHPISGSSASASMANNPYGRRLRLAEPLSPRRIANLLS
ncbi:hypothetical protein MMC10_010649 [Thelotrema lepadinum]|nr:hypothetical protein [Thelotrema lepadinum]